MYLKAINVFILILILIKYTAVQKTFKFIMA
jgi:hypothetical protein